MITMYDQKEQVYYREPSNDLEILQDMKKFEIDYSDKVVMDIGSHGGYFSINAIRNGAKKCICFEPEKNNVELLKKNEGSKIKVIARAVTGYSKLYGKLYYYGMSDTGCSSMVNATDGPYQTIFCININKIIKKYNPDIVKIDVEGMEYNIIDNIVDYKNIKTMIIDWHIYRDVHQELRIVMLNKLKKHFIETKKVDEEKEKYSIFERV